MSVDSRLMKLKSLQTRILARAISQEELDRIIELYRSKVMSHTDREQSFSKRLTLDEKKILYDVLFKPELSYMDLAKIYFKKSRANTSVIHSAGQSALKIIFQNKDKLNLKELLGGEKDEG